MDSRTGKYLPGVYRSAELEAFLKSTEKPLFDIQKVLENFYSDILPGTAPDDFLDWLFYALGGEEYNREDFDDTRKRLVLKSIFKLYRGRGTVEGIKDHLRILCGFELINYNQPPDKSFCGQSLSQEERDVFEKNQPEIRVYSFRNEGERPKNTMFVNWYLGDPAQDWNFVTYITGAINRIGDITEYYDPITDETSPLDTYYIEPEYVEKKAKKRINIQLKGEKSGIFVDDPLYGKTVDHLAKKRLYSVTLEEPYTDIQSKRKNLAVTPGLQYLRVSYDQEKIPGGDSFPKVGDGVFLSNRWPDEYPDTGGGFVSDYPIKRDAEERIYKRFKLFDPERAIYIQKERSTFIGTRRLGPIAKHTAEMFVDLQSKRYKRSIYPRLFVNGFLVMSDAGERIEKAVWASRLARPAGTKLNMFHKLRKTITVSSGLKTGDAKVGEYELRGF